MCPTNDTGRIIIHKGLGNRIIQPGDEYPGKPVDANGDYIAEKPQEQKAAPSQGAAADASKIAKLDPKEWPARDALKRMQLKALKPWAAAQGLEFAANCSEEYLLNLIDQHRPKNENQ